MPILKICQFWHFKTVTIIVRVVSPVFRRTMKKPPISSLLMCACDAAQHCTFQGTRHRRPALVWFYTIFNGIGKLPLNILYICGCIFSLCKKYSCISIIFLFFYFRMQISTWRNWLKTPTITLQVTKLLLFYSKVPYMGLFLKGPSQ